MKNTNKKKLPKILTSLALPLILIFTLLLPIISKTTNYTSFNALAISITPSESYTITFNLPYPRNKKITKTEREKAEKGLSKAFDIPLSSLKPNEHLSTPIVYLTQNAITKTYKGYIRIGNKKSNFSKIKVSFQTPQSYKSNTNKTIKTLLTAYFTLNNKPLRANIFLINKGSVLQYASMTIQDKNDNVLAMFGYGRLIEKVARVNKIGALRESKICNGDDSFVWVKKSGSVKYVKIVNPFSGGFREVSVIGQNVFAKHPFVHPNERLGVKTETLAFQKDFASAVKRCGGCTADVEVCSVENGYKFYFPSDLLNCGFCPAKERINEDKQRFFKFNYGLINPLFCLGNIFARYGGKTKNYAAVKWEFGSNIANVKISNTFPCDTENVFYDVKRKAGMLHDGDVYTKILFCEARSSDRHYGDFSASVIYTVKLCGNPYYVQFSTAEKHVLLDN